MPVLSSLDSFMDVQNIIYIDTLNYLTLEFSSLQQEYKDNVVTIDLYNCNTKDESWYEYQEYEMFAQKIVDDLKMPTELKESKKVRRRTRQRNYSRFVSNESDVWYRKQNILLNFFHYNMLMPNNDKTYECGFCNAIINDMEECWKHAETEEHKARVKEQIYIIDFTNNIIRTVNDRFHCGICNEILSQYYIEDHINTEKHAILKNYSEMCAQAALHTKNASEVLYTEIEIDKKKLSILSHNWNMICMFPKKWYCTICNVGSYVEDLKEHLISPYHVRSLNECQILPDYGFHVIRTLDEGFYHCGICNTQVHVHTIDHHIQKRTHILKLDEFMSMNKVEKPKICTKLPEINVEFNGYKFCFNINSYNTIVTHLDNFYCVVCDMLLQNDQIDGHIDTEEHKSMLEKCKAVIDFPQEYIRKIPAKMCTWAHCAICNLRMTYNTKHIKEHFACVKHKRNYKEHIENITQKSVKLRRENIPNTRISLPAEKSGHVAKFLNEFYTLKLPVNAWDCVRDHGPRIYSCSVCQTLLKSENVGKHIGINIEHKDNLAKCVVLECYGTHFLRVINWDHSVYCSFCNDLLKYYEINKHITSTIHYENIKNSIIKVDKEICSQIDRQINVDRKDIHFIMLSFINKEVIITFEAWNGIREENGFFCVLCGSKKLKDLMDHCNSDEHIKKLRKTVNDAHFVRLISKTVKQCLVCNLFFKIKINRHVTSLLHIENLKAAINDGFETSNSKDILYRINYSQFTKKKTFKKRKNNVLFNEHDFDENVSEIETYIFVENESAVTIDNSESHHSLCQYKNSANEKDEPEGNVITSKIENESAVTIDDSESHSLCQYENSANEKDEPEGNVITSKIVAISNCIEDIKIILNDIDLTADNIDVVTTVNHDMRDKILGYHKSATSEKNHSESNIATANENFKILTYDNNEVKMNKSGFLKESGVKNIVCHICGLEIPAQYYDDHIKSENHKVYMTLTDVILRRIKNNIHQKIIFIQGNCEINRNVHYCSTCNTVVSKNEVLEHGYTAIHKNNEKKVNLLKEVLDLLRDNNINTELMSEGIPSNGQGRMGSQISCWQNREQKVDKAINQTFTNMKDSEIEQILEVRSQSLLKDNILATDRLEGEHYTFKDDEDIPITDTVATILNTFEKCVVFNIGNRKIKINIDAFHGIISDGFDGFVCVLCKVNGVGEHHTTKDHIINLNKFKFKGFDMIRYLDNDFIQCGLCHLMFATADLSHHVSTKTHKGNLLLATMYLINENEGESLKNYTNEDWSDITHETFKKDIVLNNDKSLNIEDLRTIKGVEQNHNSNTAFVEKSTPTEAKPIKNTKYICKICNVWIPGINHKVDHEMGSKHLTKLKTLSDTNLNVKQSEIIEGKSTPNPNNIPYNDDICKTEIQSVSHRVDHEKSVMHMATLNSLNTENITTIPSVPIKPTTSTSYICELCDIEVHHKGDHEEGLEHLNNLKILSNSQKVTKSAPLVGELCTKGIPCFCDNCKVHSKESRSNKYFCDLCNDKVSSNVHKVDHEIMSKHITNVKSIKANEMSTTRSVKGKLQFKTYACKDCNIEVPISCKKIHELSSKHITKLNAQNESLNITSSSNVFRKPSYICAVCNVELISVDYKYAHEATQTHIANKAQKYSKSIIANSASSQELNAKSPVLPDVRKVEIPLTNRLDHNEVINLTSSSSLSDKHFCDVCNVATFSGDFRKFHEMTQTHIAKKAQKDSQTVSSQQLIAKLPVHSDIHKVKVPSTNTVDQKITSKNITNTTDEDQSEYFCHECEVKVPTSNRKEHIEGAKHKANVKKITDAVHSDIHKVKVPLTNTVDQKITSKNITNTTDEDQREYFCHECEVKVPASNRKEHNEGARHKANVKKITDAVHSDIHKVKVPSTNTVDQKITSENITNTTVEDQREYFCHECEVKVPASNRKEHIEGARHKANVKKITGAVHSDIHKVKVPLTNTDQKITSKNIINTTDEDQREYFCHECKVKVPTSNRKEHNEGARHKVNVIDNW